ncbi:MAG TPA: aldehyde dehydrogenase family protein, partial [Rhizomicrobium sp.]|nr:aldehyde dehydrogenase family protein [Rhizomicrobium sp.]
MSEFKLLIDGHLVAGDATMPIINPATEETFAQCPRASKAQLDKAVAAAKAAFPAWSKTPIAKRQAALAAIAQRIVEHTDELARILTQEQGKPLGDATAEVHGAAAFFQYFSGVDLPSKILEDSAGRKVEAHRKPLGVVGAIVPWNFPLVLMAFKVPAALLAGNTIVLKPAATTP